MSSRARRMNVVPLHPDQATASRGGGPATYTVPDVARLLGTGTAVVYRMRRAGDIPARRIGDRWITSRRQFHAWLDGDDQPAATATSSAGGAG